MLSIEILSGGFGIVDVRGEKTCTRKLQIEMKFSYIRTGLEKIELSSFIGLDPSLNRFKVTAYSLALE